MSVGLYHTLKVQDVRHESADACTITFAIPEALRTTFHYQAGQFLTLKIPFNGEELLRCYSMSSSPDLEGAVQVTVKRVVDGRASNWLCDNLRAGSALEVMKPSGVFTVKDTDRDLILFAGGSGITPVFSILKTALQSSTQHVRLIYANRDTDSIIFKHELNRLRQHYAPRLEVVHLLDTIQGVPSVALLQALCFAAEDRLAFICGPGPFMDAAETAVLAAGIDPDFIHIERFVSLQKQPSQSVKASSGAIEIEIDLFGESHYIDCHNDETILNAARRQGLTLPFSCEAGMCASCMCEVKEGNVQLLENEVLSNKDLDKKLTLTCQAIPVSERIKLRYT